MSLRIASLLVPIALLAAPGFSFAQHHGGGGHGGGAHMGGAHPGGGHPGGTFHPGAPGYHGSLNNYGYRGGYYGGIGLGYPYAGGLGYGYGGYGYGLGYPYGFGAFPLSYGMGRAYGYSPGYYSAYPAVLGAPALGAVMPSAPSYSTGSSEPAPAVVNLTVPDGAKVWFDDKETAAPGGKVTFTSPVLKPGTGATLNVKARWNDSTREMNLPIRAGDKMSVDLRNQ